TSRRNLRRLSLETLEDRVYPGDTVLGVLAISLWGPGVVAMGETMLSDRDPNLTAADQRTSTSGITGRSFPAITILQGTRGDRSVIRPSSGTTNTTETPFFAEPTPVGQAAVHLASMLFGRADWGGSAAGAATAGPNLRESLRAADFASNVGAQPSVA